MAVVFQNEEQEFVGGYAPRPLMDRILLACLYFSISRSELIRRALKRFFEDYDDTEMVVALATKIFENGSNLNYRLDKIKALASISLERRKIPEQYTILIIQEIERLYAANQGA